MTSPLSGLGGVSPLATAATTPTTTASASSSSLGSSSLLDPQAFLQLLVAQLQYQDPSNPVDTSSFMNQTAMLSQVQTMNSMSSTLTSLVSAQQEQAATSMIGKTVSYTDGAGATQSGVVTGAVFGAGGQSASVQIGDQEIPLTSILSVKAS
jgi:flagellar basal-body rod modification protein FlgD